MQRIIIADTTCLIVLSHINHLEILYKLFGEITVTSKVAEEYGVQLPSWINVDNPKDSKTELIILQDLDEGEASSIALAMESDESLLVLDDLKARKYANQLDLKIIGTLGIIVDAKLAGIIPSVKPLLRAIANTNFRITETLERIILDKANE